jgi:subtilase family serine protease
MEMAAQGQSFFAASGDLDAYDYRSGNYPSWEQESPYATVVGGTVLTMNGSGASYASETVWNRNPGGGGWGSSRQWRGPQP